MAGDQSLIRLRGAPKKLPRSPSPAPSPSASSPGLTASPTVSPTASPTATGSAPPSTGKTVLGINDGGGFDTSPELNARASAEVSRLGLKAVRMGMDGVGCERSGEACSFDERDPAVQARLDKDIAIHAVVSFRFHVKAGANEQEWARNFGWKCGQIAAHYRGKVQYYIVDNEPDLAYGDGQLGVARPALVVKMQQACYEAIKGVDTAIRVESAPAQSPEATYNRELLAGGIAQYADVIGTHLYGGQLTRDAIKTLRGYMAEHKVDKPIACSECGTLPSWYTAGGETHKGLTGKEARAQWIRDFAVYAREVGLDNALYFSIFSVQGEWEMHDDPLAMQALYDVGHS